MTIWPYLVESGSMLGKHDFLLCCLNMHLNNWPLRTAEGKNKHERCPRRARFSVLPGSCVVGKVLAVCIHLNTVQLLAAVKVQIKIRTILGTSM